VKIKDTKTSTTVKKIIFSFFQRFQVKTKEAILKKEIPLLLYMKQLIKKSIIICVFKLNNCNISLDDSTRRYDEK